MTLELAKRIVISVPLAATDDDIILEILLRLPVESLLRCKSVCKSWLSLISDPFFIKSHLKLSSTKIEHHRLIFTNCYPINIKSCPLNDVLFEKSAVNSLDHVSPSYSHLYYYNLLCHIIVGSCNGLVCILCLNSKVNMLFIWNPSTKISTTLYPAFDMPPIVYGFAYDKATDDYKVVSVSLRNDYQVMRQNKVKIYSLKTRIWKQIGDFPHGYPVNMSGVFSNGFLHWISTPTLRESYIEPIYQCTIVSLDLASETYGEVSQPVYDEKDKVLTLGALGEWLCMLCNNRETCADVWVMKVYGVEDSWTKLASVTYPADIYSPYPALPLFISNDGTILLQVDYDFVVHDFNDGSSFKLKNFDGCGNATTFFESLVSPDPAPPKQLLITTI